MTDSATCDCRGASPQSGFRYDPDLDLWVHSTCGKPTKLYLNAEYQRALEADGGV